MRPAIGRFFSEKALIGYFAPQLGFEHPNTAKMARNPLALASHVSYAYAKYSLCFIRTILYRLSNYVPYTFSGKFKFRRVEARANTP